MAHTAEAVLTTLSYSPSASALSDLGHDRAYTWRLDDLPADTVLGASITFSNMESMDAGANKLFGHLLDSARDAGVDSFIDGSSSRRMADLTDDFANSRHHGSADWLVAPGTDSTKLFGKSFSMTPTTWTYTFNEAEVAKLNQYLTDGSIAFGFDSDSHYFNEGVSFSMIVGGSAAPPIASPIPEPAAVLPLATVLLMAVAVQSRSRRRAETLPA